MKRVIRQSLYHGGVAALDDEPSHARRTELAQQALASGGVVQQRVRRAFTVDGAAMDLGVYVLVRGVHADDGDRPTTGRAIPWEWEALQFDDVLVKAVQA